MMISRSLLLTLFAAFSLASCESPPAGIQKRDLTEAPATTQETPVKTVMNEAAQVASLIDPGKLATLGERGANPRIQKITAILATAKAQGKIPEEIAKQAVKQIGWADTPKGDLTAAAILRNLRIAESLGATTSEDIANMRKGKTATVRKGPYFGERLSVDHIIPRSVAPELDNVIANLELMPLRLNQAKGNMMGQRQRDLARKLHAAGILKSELLLE
ncbi:MAG: hypothetical protein ACK56K_01120 [Akkermansiaceae bacterium]|jgi:hypothetical protein